MFVEDSPRLRFALMDAEDADLLFELDQDPQVMRYINGGQVTTMEDVHQIFLPRMASYRDPQKGWGLYKVHVKESDTFIGWVLVRPMDFFNDSPQWDNLELGWRFKRSAWGKGYGTEAAKAIKEALSASGVRRFSAMAMKENSGSIGIMLKLGMQYVKTDILKDPLGDMEVVFYTLDES